MNNRCSLRIGEAWNAAASVRRLVEAGADIQRDDETLLAEAIRDLQSALNTHMARLPAPIPRAEAGAAA